MSASAENSARALSALPVSCAAHPLGDCKLARSDERLKNDLFRLKRLLPKSLRVEPRKCRRSPGSQWRYHALQLRLGVDGKLVPHEAEQEAIREMAGARRPRTLVK